MANTFLTNTANAIGNPNNAVYVMHVDGTKGQNVAEVSPTLRMRVQQDGTQLFYEAWDSGAIDTVYAWNSAVVSGTGAASTPSAGQELLVGGTQANAYAYLTSKQKFQPVSPGFLEFNHQIALTNPLPAHGYCFFGCGNPNATPTSTTYGIDCVGFEVGATGKMSAVTWQGTAGVGTRVLIADLSASGTNTQPLDGAVHRYQLFIRGDTIYWVIDNVSVASILTGANGPNSNLLPVLMLSGADATGASSALTLNSAAIYVADTTKSFNRSIASPYGGGIIYSAQGGTGNALLTNTVVQIKGSAAALYSLDLANLASATTYLQIFDALSSAVALGTTVPKLSVLIAANGGTRERVYAFDAKVGFNSGLSIAATTTPNGSTAPGTGLNANIGYM